MQVKYNIGVLLVHCLSSSHQEQLLNKGIHFNPTNSSWYPLFYNNNSSSFSLTQILNVTTPSSSSSCSSTYWCIYACTSCCTDVFLSLLQPVGQSVCRQQLVHVLQLHCNC
jgi:hypothetical protein